MIRYSALFVLAALTLATPPAAAAPAVTTEPAGSGIRVLIDGVLFTAYIGEGAQRPYMYPVIGPSGANLTRPYPMEKGGAEDHPHHRSFWFAHGLVNDVDFWADGEKHGKQVHQGIRDVESGPGWAAFTAATQWLTAKGAPVLDDERRIRIAAREDGARSVG